MGDHLHDWRPLTKAERAEDFLCTEKLLSGEECGARAVFLPTCKGVNEVNYCGLARCSEHAPHSISNVTIEVLRSQRFPKIRALAINGERVAGANAGPWDVERSFTVPADRAMNAITATENT